MNILIIGKEEKVIELQKIIPSTAKVTVQEDLGSALELFDIIIDTEFDSNSNRLHQYAPLTHKTVVVSAAKIQLAATVAQYGKAVNCFLVGMNMLPTLINRSLVELTIANEDASAAVEQLAAKLNWNVRVVEDRVGMVTPRIILMIINEACYTLQEGTANIKDIDTAMKLGTNYPLGPFEWADKIGIKNVYEVLEVVYDDTKEERYKICPLLKTKYLKQEKFYN